MSQTLKNLQAAFEGESNAAARYTAFAKKAEDEGYSRVSVLFRATARAEQIHAAHHAKVITKLGATPEAKISEPVIGTTAENLAVAKNGEEYERDVMYPEFIREAEASGEASAVRTFRMASAAEAVHADLYGAALANLEAQRMAAIFYVCPLCGEVTDDDTMKTCPICNVPFEKFEVFRWIPSCQLNR
ncbi:MAG: rubrerythrin [Acidobacteria bacterium]|nr:MAG: rubrerythrin [Acidobacteriota bacterium]